MRRRTKVKGYMPFIAAGLYGLVLKWVTESLGIPTEEYIVPIVLIWAVVVGWSVTKMDSIIDAWDTNNLEEENE